MWGTFADWEDYNEVYLLGREPMIAETSFKFYATQATNRIQERVMPNYAEDEIDYGVVYATCAIAERLFLLDRDGNREIRRISDSGATIEYNQGSRSDLKVEADNDIDQIMWENLEKARLYVGVM